MQIVLVGTTSSTHFLMKPIKQAEKKSDLICRKVGGGGICRRPGRESSSGQVHDHHAC